MWKWVFMALLVMPAAVLACDDPVSPAMYGPGIGGDVLANTTLGSGDRNNPLYHRFRAEQSSPLVSFTFYYMGGSSGYSGGTGGLWKAEVLADDGTCQHLPTGPALASQTVQPRKADIADYRITFDRPATLMAGRLYHLVFTNIDADPEHNYFSPDYWYYWQTPTGLADGRDQPKFAKPDWVHGYYDGFAHRWLERPGFSPILDLTHANGKHQGMNYGEASYGAGEVGKIQGVNMVRERFTVSGPSKTIRTVGFRMLRQRQTGYTSLVVRIEDANGNVLRTRSIPATSISEGPGFNPNNPSEPQLTGANAKWFKFSFSAPLTLESGRTYNLRFSTAAGSTVYWAWVNRRLSASYSYAPATAFQDGHAEKTTDGATWSSLGRTRNENDLQFYLR